MQCVKLLFTPKPETHGKIGGLNYGQIVSFLSSLYIIGRKNDTTLFRAPTREKLETTTRKCSSSLFMATICEQTARGHKYLRVCRDENLNSKHINKIFSM